MHATVWTERIADKQWKKLNTIRPGDKIINTQFIVLEKGAEYAYLGQIGTAVCHLKCLWFHLYGFHLCTRNRLAVACTPLRLQGGKGEILRGFPPKT